jgi:hypothetical protein
MALRPIQPPIQWVSEALSLAVKRPGLEADHSPPSSAEVKECAELYLHSPNKPSWRGAQLKHRDNFIINFTFLFWNLIPKLSAICYNKWASDIFLLTIGCHGHQFRKWWHSLLGSLDILPFNVWRQAFIKKFYSFMEWIYNISPGLLWYNNHHALINLHDGSEKQNHFIYIYSISPCGDRGKQ